MIGFRWSGRPATGAPLRSLLCNRRTSRTIRISSVLGTLIDIFLLVGSIFRDVHWLNFGWGEEVDPVSGNVTLVHHPNKVWMCCTYSDREPWKKVKILKESPGSVPLEQLYHAPLLLKPAKVHDLKKMARDHIPHPHRDFYLQMSGHGDGGRETEEEDDD